MVSHGFGESRLDALEALVDRVWIPAVQRDQLFSRLAAPDDFKRVNLDPSNVRFRNRGRRLRPKPSSVPARFDFIIGVLVRPG